jgi:hypothetical protein
MIRRPNERAFLCSTASANPLLALADGGMGDREGLCRRVYISIGTPVDGSAKETKITHATLLVQL